MTFNSKPRTHRGTQPRQHCCHLLSHRRRRSDRQRRRHGPIGFGRKAGGGCGQRRSSSGAADLVRRARALGSRGELMTFKGRTRNEALAEDVDCERQGRLLRRFDIGRCDGRWGHAASSYGAAHAGGGVPPRMATTDGVTTNGSNVLTQPSTQRVFRSAIVAEQSFSEVCRTRGGW